MHETYYALTACCYEVDSLGDVFALVLKIFHCRSTYATTIRDSKYAREREFLKAVCICKTYFLNLQAKTVYLMWCHVFF